ncbi:unnamed protein product [Thelazia callipaeda]|uniref:Col_cuticle_N domain-containing protein n=1 Tax=Thelazia callipaeda TaxID=103827 RepID=A0A0N5CYZ3_THECL|nr:unnamed protein product [Thelazia callipaeda]
MNDEKSSRQSLKPIAFISVVFSTFAICSVLVAFPLIINYVQTLESFVQMDLDFCRPFIKQKCAFEIKLKTSPNILKKLPRKFFYL